MRAICRFMILGVAVFFSSGWACDYCLLVQGVSPLQTSGGKGLRMYQRYTRLSILYDDGKEAAGSDAVETHWTTQFNGFYSLTPRLMVMAVVPVVRRSGSGEEEVPADIASAEVLQGSNRAFVNGSSAIHSSAREEGATGTSFGLGDVALLGRYLLTESHDIATTFLTSMQLGVRFPTGSSTAKNDQGEYLDVHLQPGTGAFNFLVGLSANYVKERIGLVANGLFSIPTEGTVGDQTYQFGNALNYDVSFRYRFTPFESGVSLFGALGVVGEYREKEKQNGVELDDTGGHTIYLAPSIEVYLQKFLFEVSFWQPIAHHLNGTQLGETFKTYAGISLIL